MPVIIILLEVITISFRNIEGIVITFIIFKYINIFKWEDIKVETSKKSNHSSSWTGDKIFTSDKSNAERNVTNR